MGLPKREFSTGKKHFTPGKKSRKMTLPPQKNFPLYAVGIEQSKVLYHLFFQLLLSHLLSTHLMLHAFMKFCYDCTRCIHFVLSLPLHTRHHYNAGVIRYVARVFKERESVHAWAIWGTFKSFQSSLLAFQVSLDRVSTALSLSELQNLQVGSLL